MQSFDVDSGVAGILLAAGQSTRFGSPKQLVCFRTKPLLFWSLDASLASELTKVYLVLGHFAARIRMHLKPYLDNPRLEIVENPDFKQGMGSSLARGIRFAGKNWRAYMIMLADQPLVTPALINAMLTAMENNSKSIVIPTCRQIRGNPVLFANKWYSALSGLNADFGGRYLVARNPKDVLEFEVESEHYFWDIDCPQDLQRLNP